MFQEHGLASPEGSLILRSNISRSNLTVRFFIWSSINRSCDGCSNHVNTLVVALRGFDSPVVQGHIVVIQRAHLDPKPLDPR